jgi:hypothetical protein
MRGVMKTVECDVICGVRCCAVLARVRSGGRGLRVKDATLGIQTGEVRGRVDGGQEKQHREQHTGPVHSSCELGRRVM